MSDNNITKEDDYDDLLKEDDKYVFTEEYIENEISIKGLTHTNLEKFLAIMTAISTMTIKIENELGEFDIQMMCSSITNKTDLVQPIALAVFLINKQTQEVIGKKFIIPLDLVDDIDYKRLDKCLQGFIDYFSFVAWERFNVTFYNDETKDEKDEYELPEECDKTHYYQTTNIIQ